MTRGNFLFFLSLFGWLTISACHSRQRNDEHVVSETSGNSKALPAMQLRDLSGNMISSDQLSGKKVFINLWATWCPPCIAEMPSIQKLYDKTNQNNDVAFVMISLDDDFNTARKFAQKKGYNLPIYELVGNTPDLFNVPGIPATFVFDQQGKMLFSHVGMADYSKPRFVQMLKP